MIDAVKYLITKGTNIEEKDKDESTPLHHASCFGKIDVVIYMVSKWANKNTKDKNGKTPYDLTSSERIRNILK